MKIRVSVTRHNYGYVDLEVPPDSPILDCNASSIKKRRYAKRLAEKAIAGDNPHVVWFDQKDSLRTFAGLCYFIIDDAGDENG